MNNSGAVVNHLVYDSFGQVISQTNSTVNSRYLFTGREFDQEIGLYYYRARYYDANTGRFISSDPIGLNGGTNIYTYVRGNPIFYTDPMGLAACYIEYQGYPITIPGTDTKISLWHAGALTYDPETGSTRYYEYGRYDSDFGEVKRRTVPNLEIGPDGNPTQKSWDKLKDYLSKNYGHDKPIKSQCDKDSDFDKANDFADKRMKDKKRQPYSWSPFSENTCTTFAHEVVKAGRNK